MADNDLIADPPDLAEWSLHCYCPTARQTPHSLIREGSNGRLLYEARVGTTVSRLRAQGITVTEDQLGKLSAFGLLAVDGDRLRTRFPVLGGSTTTALRRLLRAHGAALADRITHDVTELRDVLVESGFSGSGYALVFGHALDGVLWQRLQAADAVPETTLCAARPWWSGAFWALHPARTGASGTNFVDCGCATLVLVWTSATSRDLHALATAEQVRPVVADLLADHPVTDGVVTDAAGRGWHLRRPDGPAIPVVGDGGNLDALAGRIADVVAEALLGDELAAARDLVPDADRAVSTVVVAHELIWEVTEALIASGALALPRAHYDESASLRTLIDLLYVTVAGSRLAQ